MEAQGSPTLSLPVPPQSREVGERSLPPSDSGGNKDRPQILRKGVKVLSQPFPHPRHLFLLLTAEGLPRRLFHLAGGQQKEHLSLAPGLRIRGTRLALGPEAPGEGTGCPGSSQPMVSRPTRAGRTNHPFQLHPPLGLRTRSQRPQSNGARPASGEPSYGWDRRPPRAEVEEQPEVAGVWGGEPGRQTLTGAGAAQGSWWPWSWASFSTTSPSTSRRCACPDICPPLSKPASPEAAVSILSLPHPRSLWRLVQITQWEFMYGLALLCIPCMASLGFLKFIPDFLVEIKRRPESRTSLIHPDNYSFGLQAFKKNFFLKTNMS